MESDQVKIAAEADRSVLRLEGILGVSSAEELRQAALQLCAYQKDVQIDWSGATQIDAAVAQVLLSLRAGLVDQKRCLGSCGTIPPQIRSWLNTAGLSAILGDAGQGV